MAVDLRHDVDKLAKHCREAKAFYEKSPGLVQPDTIMDLYLCIAQLAEIVRAVEDRRRVGF
jgi:hypothetical protein